MKIINRVKISYFRSIYTAELKDCQSVNILTGKNDSGKSNILRALNLFFNEDTDFGTALDFFADLSIRRKEEVRKETIKGKQFIAIELEFHRPPNFSGSLPERFSVTRKWHRNQPRYDQYHNLESINRVKPLPSKVATAERSLSTFLSRIHYEYIPAVKDRGYFRHLLQRLQQTLLEAAIEDEEAIGSMANSLAGAIQGKIINLRDDFKRATGLESDIEPPQKLSSLFQAFEVGTQYAAQKVSLNSRGDGIQVRFVPAVLNYIANNLPNMFFIWGFEEPENSLEMLSAESLADDVIDIYAKKSQIFLTSHSAAFISRIGEKICGYRVVNNGASSEVTPISTPAMRSSVLARDVGHLQIYKNLSAQYKAERDRLRKMREVADKLEAEMAEIAKPLLIVEGDSDKLLIETAHSKIYAGDPLPFEVRSANVLFGVADVEGPAGGASMLTKAIESFHPSNKRRALALYDADEAGIKEYAALSANFKAAANATHKTHQNTYSLATTIPRIRGAENYYDNGNLSIEFLFPEDVLTLKTQDGKGLHLEDPITHIVINNKRKPVQLTAEQMAAFVYLRKVGDGKMIFSEKIVPTLSVDKFAAFAILLKHIRKLLQIDARAKRPQST